MKKRVISWLLCLALCLSMLPMAALAEDVQAPEGPAPSMNEPQPEPRAKENETPAPEPEKKVQSELMTAEKLLMPLASGETFSLSPIYVMQNSAEISDDITDTGVLKQSVNVVIYIYGLTKEQVASLLPATVHGIKASVDGVEVSSGGSYDETAGGWRHTWSFTPTKNEYTIDFSINYDGTEQTAQRTIKFESCKHPSRNNAGKCSQCGAALVAEINSATYYASLSEALDAAQTIDDCTITLLDDAGLSGDYTVTKGKFTIDLKTFSQGSGTINVAGTAYVTVKNKSAGQFEGNFCWSSADAKLTLAENSAYANLTVTAAGKTIADLLPGGCGYQVSGNWVSESELSQTTIQNVLVKTAPFTVGDFIVNSSAYYINVPFTISASVRSSSFPNGHIDFDYCLYIDGIEKKTGNQNTRSQLSMDDCTLEDGNQHTAKLVVSYNGYSVTKTLVLQAVACPHTIIGQTTGQCTVCKLQMAAYVLDKGKYVQDRRYYKTFKDALENVWVTLDKTDCTLGIFEDTTVSSAITRDLISQRHTLTVCLNGKTLERTGGELFRALKIWNLIIQGESGTLKANSSTGVINASNGASLTIYGPITITNTNQNGYGIYTQGSSGDLANVEIYADRGNSVGSLYVNGGEVRLNSGTAGKVEVRGSNSLFYVEGGGRAGVSGTVTVQENGKLETGYGYNPVFEDDVTIKSDGWASLRQGEFRKTLKLEPGTYNKTLRRLLFNGADDFYIGGVYQKNAKEQTEISANGENYVTIGRGHTHDYDNTGKCKYCDAEAEAKLYFDDNGVSKSEFGSFTTMLTKAQDYENSNLVLWKDSMLYSDATVTKGKFYISGGTKRLQSNGTAALVISGGDVQIADITVDRLKVTGDGKLTLNGGKYYAIDVAGSTYANYGQLLPDDYAFKASTGWEAKGDITAASFESATAKEVKILPLRSVTISADGETTVPYGTSVKFTATVEPNSSSGTTYKWFCDGVEIPDDTTNELTVAKDIGSYEYRCDVTRDGYTLSSNTVQLTVQRIGLSDAALSATIQTRAYDGSANATVTASSIGSSGLRANTDYTISAEFEDANAEEGKKVTVKVTLTLARGNLPDGAVVTVSGTDEAGNAVTLTDNGDGTYSATLPNKTQTYTFTAVYDESQTIAPKTGFTTVKVQQRLSGGGEPAKPSFPVKISNSGDGVAKVDKSYASAGAKVTITVTPGRNATVQRITVTDEDGQRLKLTENRDGTYSFTMPNGAANVYARFSGSGLPFADVPSGSWYYDDVAYVYDTGLMTGLTVTAFGPNLSTTRGMIVTILWRMENEPAAKHGCPFADVRRGSYYEQAIAWASENGIVTGFDASTFAPDRAITREQLAAILFRFAAYRGMDAVTLRENLSSFQDQAAISVYAVSALNWAVSEGLMQGTGDKLEPTGSATRAQVAAMLRRFIQRNF